MAQQHDDFATSSDEDELGGIGAAALNSEQAALYSHLHKSWRTGEVFGKTANGDAFELDSMLAEYRTCVLHGPDSRAIGERLPLPALLALSLNRWISRQPEPLGPAVCIDTSKAILLTGDRNVSTRIVAG